MCPGERLFYSHYYSLKKKKAATAPIFLAEYRYSLSLPLHFGCIAWSKRDGKKNTNKGMQKKMEY